MASKKAFICDWCKSEYERYPSQRRGKHSFCSMECRIAFVNDNKANTHFRSTCDNCGKDIDLYKWEIDHFKHHFCSPECQYQYLSGENHHFYGKHLEEEAIEKMKATKKKNYKKENHPMYGKQHSEKAKEKMRQAHLNPSDETRKLISKNHAHIHGSDHYNWKGGVSLEEFEKAYGIEMKEWKLLAKKIRERDNYTCQYCGAKRSTHVHHIMPRTSGIDNSEDNLITLCSHCHPYIERRTNKMLEKNIEPISIFYEK